MHVFDWQNRSAEQDILPGSPHPSSLTRVGISVSAMGGFHVHSPNLHQSENAALWAMDGRQLIFFSIHQGSSSNSMGNLYFAVKAINDL
jgi:hypothetical protein